MKTRSFSSSFPLLLALSSVIFALSVLLLAPQTKAANGINRQLNYQAKLLDSSGAPVADGTYSIKFSLYDAPTAGNRLYTATGTLLTPTALNVSVQNGLFTVLLGDTAVSGGSQNALDNSIDWNSNNLYLGVTVGSDAEMSPRKRIGAVAQAFNAEQLQGMFASSTVASGGGTLFTVNQTTNNAAANTRSALDVKSGGTSNANDYLLRGINDLGTVVLSVNRQGNVTSSGSIAVTGSTSTFEGVSSTGGVFDDYLTVTGKAVCLSDGTNCTIPSTINPTNVTWVNATGTNTTSTNLFVTNETATNIAVNNLTSLISPNSTFSVATTTTLTSQANDIFVSGKLAFVVTSTDLDVLDVTDPSRPTVIGGLTLSGTSLSKVVVKGTYAYTTDQVGNKLYIVDVSSPAAPRLVGTESTMTGPTGISVDGHYAYVGGFSSDFYVVDVSNPANPFVVGHIASLGGGGHIFDVAVEGNYAYVTNGPFTTFFKIDITNPENPFVAGSHATVGDEVSLKVQGPYAYLAGTSGLEIFDISGPANPGTVALVPIGASGAQGIFLAGRYAYITGPSDSIVDVVDVQNPSSASVVKTFASGINGPITIFVEGRYAYVGNAGDNTLTIIDLSGIETSALVAHTAEIGDLQVMSNGSIANQFAVGGGLIVGNDGIRTDGSLSVDATNTTSTFGGFVSSTGGTYSNYLTVNGKAVCLSDGTNCAAGGDSNWTFNATGDFVRNATPTTDLVLGSTATSTGAPVYFDLSGGTLGTSTVFFGNATNTNVVIGGTSTTNTGLNAAFVMNGNDLFVAGNIGSVSSVYTNGEFVVGPGSTHFGDGYINKNNGNLTLAASGGFILPSSDMAVSLGDAALRFNGEFGNTTTTNATTTNLFGSYGDFTTLTGGTFSPTNLTWTNATGTNTTSTNAFATNGTITNLSFTGATGTWINGTTVTSTNLFAAGVTTTDLYATNGTFGTMNVSNFTWTNATGTNTTSTNLYGASLSFANASGTNATSSNLAVTNVLDNTLRSTSAISLTTTTDFGLSVPTGVYVANRFAYAVRKNTLIILNASNPSNPTTVSTAVIGGGNLDHIFVSGRYAYIASSGTNSLMIVDISNPSAPFVVSTISGTLLSPKTVYVSGKYAYIGDVNAGNSFLHIVDISDPAKPAFMGSLGGLSEISAIQVVGRYAYVSDESGVGFAVIDVSNPYAPVLIGSVVPPTAAGVAAMAVQGRYAFVAPQTSGLVVSSTVDVIDAVSPAAPTVVASVNLGGQIRHKGMFVNGRYLYVVTDDNKLNVIDVLDPLQPALLQSALSGNLVGDAGGVFVDGRYVYVGNNGANSISVFDTTGAETTSLTAHSAEVGSLQVLTDGTIGDELRVGGSLNVGQGGILSSGALGVSATNTTSTILGGLSIGTSTNSGMLNSAFSVSGDGLLVAGNIGSVSSVYTNGEFVVGPGSTHFGDGYINKNNGNLTLAASGGFILPSSDMAVSLGDAALRFNGEFGNTTTTNATTTNLFGSYGDFTTLTGGTFSPTNLTWTNATGTNTTSTNAFATNFSFSNASGSAVTTTQLQVRGSINNTLTGASTYSIPGSVSVDANPRNLVVAGKYGYVTNFFGNTLSILDLTTPAQPRLVGTFNGLNEPLGVAVNGHYAFVSNFTGNTVSVIDISNPAIPVGVATTTGFSSPFGIAISGRFAYVANNGANTLSVVDIADPTNPQIVGSVGGLSFPIHVAVAGHFVYVPNNGPAGAGTTMSVIDVSNPQSPAIVGTASGLPPGPYGIAVSGRYAFVSSVSGGTLSVIDIASSTNPFPAQTVSGSGFDNPHGVFVSGRYVYVANDGASNDLLIVDASSPTSSTVVANISGFSSPYGVYVSGRYAYVANNGNNTVSVVDINGLETNGLVAHAAELGSLQVLTNGYIANQLVVGGGLNVDGGGIASNGALSVYATNTTSTFNGPVSSTGGTFSNYLTVNGKSVCLGDGTGCALGTDLNWTYSNAGNFVRNATATTDVFLGSTATSTGAPVYFNLTGGTNGTSTVYFGNATNTNVVIGGTSTTNTGLNANFVLNGNDLFAAGNIGSASSVYTNGEFVVGTGSTHFGDGYVTRSTGNLTIQSGSNSSNNLLLESQTSGAVLVGSLTGGSNSGLMPIVDNQTNLGGGSNRWSQLITGQAGVNITDAGGATGFKIQNNSHIFQLRDDVGNNTDFSYNGAVSGGLNSVSRFLFGYAGNWPGLNNTPAEVNIGQTLTNYPKLFIGLAPNQTRDAFDIGPIYGAQNSTGTVFSVHPDGSVYASGTYVGASLNITGNATTTNATSTNLFATNGNFTNLTAGTMNISNLTWTSSTGTNTTSTNLFASNLSFTNATGSSVTSTNVYVQNSLTNTLSASTGALARKSLTNLNPLPTSVVVQGQYAYVGHNGASPAFFDVINIANPSSPVIVTSTVVGGGAESMAVSGHYAYLAENTSNQVQVVDVSNPASSTVIFTGPLTAPKRVFISGHIGYFTASGGLYIVDISNPYGPNLLSIFSSGLTNPYGVTVNGKYAYVTDISNDTIHVIDVRDPQNPVQVGVTTTDGGSLAAAQPREITVQGGYAYVANVNDTATSFSVIDITDAANPRYVTSLATTFNAIDTNSLFVNGRYAYLLENDSKIHVIDIINPTSPVEVATSAQFLNTPHGLWVSGRYAYTNITSSNRMEIYDVTGIETNGLNAQSAQIGSLQVTADGYVMNNLGVGDGLTIGRGGLHSEGALAVDTTNTTSSIQGNLLVGDYKIGTPLNSAFVMDGNDLYAAGNIGSVSSVYTNGEFVVGPGSTHFGDGYINKNNGNLTLAASGGFVLPSSDMGVALGDSTFRFNGEFGNTTTTNATTTNLAVSNSLAIGGNLQATPNASSIFALLGTTSGFLSAQAYRVAIQGQYAYIAGNDPFGHIYVVDISNAANPSLAGSYSYGFVVAHPQGIAVQGHYAYVTEANASSPSLDIFDISNPAHPTLISQTPTVGSVSGISVSGRYAYVNELYQTFVDVVDVSNPAKPSIVSRVNLLEDPGLGSYVQGNYLYVPNGSHFSVVDITDPLNPINRADLSGFSGATDTVVQGKWAYVADDGIFNDVKVVNVANPASPSISATISGLSTPLQVAVNGRYLYISDNGNNAVKVYDVNLPSSPVSLTSISMPSFGGTGGIAVTGRMLIALDANGEFNIFDTTGIETDGLLAASVQAGTLQVTTNGTIAGQLDVGGSLSVGGGINSSGPLSVYATSSSSTANFVNGSISSAGSAWGAYINTLLVGNNAFATGTNNFSQVITYNGGTRSGLCLDNTATAPTCITPTGVSIQADDAINASGFDLAERYNVSGSVTSSDVLVLDTTTSSTVKTSTGVPYDPNVIGVASTKPGFLLGFGNGPSVALTGHVPTKVSTVNGNIAVGDALTTSQYPGYAMKATKPGKILGYALDSATATSTMDVFVNVGYDASMTLNTDGQVAQVVDSLVMASTSTATALNPAVDSWGLTFRGSAWNGSLAVNNDFTLLNEMANSSSSKFALRNTSSTDILTVDQNGNALLSGDLVVGGKFFPSARGTAQTSTYLFVDNTMGTSTYIASNADGWQAMDSYDFAERYYSPDKLENGDLVVASAMGQLHVQRSWDEHTMLLGIVSTKPGFVTGAPTTSTYPIALAGRVPTKVSTIKGAISIGDPLAPSTIPGVAVKATQAGPIVGEALADYNAPDVGKIEVFVNPGWWGGPDQAAATPTASQTGSTPATPSGSGYSGLALVSAGDAHVHVTYPTLNSYPNVQATPQGEVDGGWWTSNWTDTGFDIVFKQPQTHDVTFAWHVDPTGTGSKIYLSNGTSATVDPTSGNLVTTTVSSSTTAMTTSTSSGTTASTGTSNTSTGTTIDTATTTASSATTATATSTPIVDPSATSSTASGTVASTTTSPTTSSTTATTTTP